MKKVSCLWTLYASFCKRSTTIEQLKKMDSDNSEAHIKDLKESIIKEALSSGVDLRVFSLEVETQLKQVSNIL